MAYGGAAGQISSLQIDRFITSGRRMSVPVRPSQTVYTQYRHVSGTPASSEQTAVPVSRVQLLNSLIDKLQKVKKDSSYQQVSSDPSPARTDAMIRQYANELHQALAAAPRPFGTMGGVSGSGMLFNISA